MTSPASGAGRTKRSKLVPSAASGRLFKVGASAALCPPCYGSTVVTSNSLGVGSFSHAHVE